MWGELMRMEEGAVPELGNFALLPLLSLAGSQDDVAILRLHASNARIVDRIAVFGE